MAYQAPTIESVRERFTALRNPLAFFDGPAGTQVPDSVIQAISVYLQAANANLGGAFMTSKMSDGVVDAARVAASELLGAYADEVIFGANTTSLNFALSRTVGARVGRGRRGRRDEARPRREHLAVARARARQGHHRPPVRLRRRGPARPRPAALAASPSARAWSRSRGPRTRSAP